MEQAEASIRKLLSGESLDEDDELCDFTLAAQNEATGELSSNVTLLNEHSGFPSGVRAVMRYNSSITSARMVAYLLPSIFFLLCLTFLLLLINCGTFQYKSILILQVIFFFQLPKALHQQHHRITYQS